MTVSNNEEASMPADTISGFTYLIRSTQILALPVDTLSMVGDAWDMERGVLHLPPVSRARYCYLPVQAIPQGMAVPDLIVDIADGEDMLTRLHFCTIWRGMQRDDNPEAWERVAYPTRRLALLYNDVRLHLCHSCHHLHKFSCVLSEHQRKSASLCGLT